ILSVRTADVLSALDSLTWSSWSAPNVPFVSQKAVGLYLNGAPRKHVYLSLCTVPLTFAVSDRSLHWSRCKGRPLADVSKQSEPTMEIPVCQLRNRPGFSGLLAVSCEL